MHREVILYANRQFASLVGVDRVELIGRRLADLVPPEYAELVSENIARRLAGEHAAERYEIDMVGLQGQVSRLEITSTAGRLRRRPRAADHRRRDHPDADRADTAPARRERRPQAPQLLALQSLAEAIITTDEDGRISFMNSAAEQLTGTEAARCDRQTARGDRRRWSTRASGACWPTRCARRSPAARPST